jgi:hypothetical protein
MQDKKIVNPSFFEFFSSSSCSSSSSSYVIEKEEEKENEKNDDKTRELSSSPQLLEKEEAKDKFIMKPTSSIGSYEEEEEVEEDEEEEKEDEVKEKEAEKHNQLKSPCPSSSPFCRSTTSSLTSYNSSPHLIFPSLSLSFLHLHSLPFFPLIHSLIYQAKSLSLRFVDKKREIYLLLWMVDITSQYKFYRKSAALGTFAVNLFKNVKFVWGRGREGDMCVCMCICS